MRPGEDEVRALLAAAGHLVHLHRPRGGPPLPGAHGELQVALDRAQALGAPQTTHEWIDRYVPVAQALLRLQRQREGQGQVILRAARGYMGALDDWSGRHDAITRALLEAVRER